jgi:hypothetical protein
MVDRFPRGKSPVSITLGVEEYIEIASAQSAATGAFRLHNSTPATSLAGVLHSNCDKS